MATPIRDLARGNVRDTVELNAGAEALYEKSGYARSWAHANPGTRERFVVRARIVRDAIDAHRTAAEEA